MSSKIARLIFLSSLVLLTAGAVSAQERKAIELPEVPSSLTAPSDRADYIILHFWDSLDFGSDDRKADSELMEQSMVDFLSVMPYASSGSVAADGFASLLKKASVDPQAFRMMTELAETYLYSPDSPMRSEELYLDYLTALYGQPGLSDTERFRVADRIEIISKNRVGTPAADFSFTTRDGSEATLYDSLPEGERKLLLIFFDPECENCGEAMEMIKKDRAISEETATGRLKILAIYSGDNETSWRRKASGMPADWTVGINAGDIEEEDLYYFPEMPTIYLIDSKGMVVGKEINVSSIAEAASASRNP